MAPIIRRLVAPSLLLIALLGCAEKPETRFTGAYQIEDGRIVFVAPREGEQLRFRLMNGDSGVLWPAGENAYEGGPGWSEREPVINRFRFAADASSLEWTGVDGAARVARKVPLPERIVTFDSGPLRLRGKLVTPQGEGPFPAIVLVHGSDDYSAVDHYYEPYLYAAHGFASLVFDKRGTGESDGEYLQNFHVLSDDVVAAVRWLRTQKEIDADDIHLAGFSQGGWIAPLAALKDGRIRSVLVGYGVMKPVTAEDRWGYIYALQQKGFGAAEIAQADRLNAVVEDIMDRGQNRWDELGEMLDASKGAPWFEALRGSDSILGRLADSRLPLTAWRTYLWWRTRADVPFIDRLYDPAPTMQKLAIPSVWLLAGEDSSAPAAWTIEELDKLKSAGKPVEYFVYPQAEHGILRFTQNGDGERSYLGYEPDYFARQIGWFERQRRGAEVSDTKVTQNSATLSRGMQPSSTQ